MRPFLRLLATIVLLAAVVGLLSALLRRTGLPDWLVTGAGIVVVGGGVAALVDRATTPAPGPGPSGGPPGEGQEPE